MWYVKGGGGGSYSDTNSSRGSSYEATIPSDAVINAAAKALRYGGKEAVMVNSK